MPWQQGITQCDSVTKSTVSKVTHFLAFLVLEKLGWHSLSKWGMGLVDWLIGWLIGKWANKLPNFTLFPLLWLQFTVLHQFLWSWIQKCPSFGWNLSGAIHHCCYTTKLIKSNTELLLSLTIIHTIELSIMWALGLLSPSIPSFSGIRKFL